MKNQTAIMIVATGIVLLLLCVWWLMRSITSEIIDTSNLIDSLRIDMEKRHQAIQDSFPFTYDSTSFTFDTSGVDPKGYILKSDDSVNIIFMNKEGEKTREDKIWLDNSK